MYNNALISILKSANCGGRTLNILLALSLVVTLLLPMASSPMPAPRVQPLLLHLATERPDETVAVIVQKMAKDARVEDLVARLGGTVAKDLHIINAFAAEMTASDALQLARADGVRWVSLDASVESTGGRSAGEGTAPPNYFLDTLGVRQVWDMGLRGEGVTVAVIDSGITNDADFRPNRIVASIRFNFDAVTTADAYGHGTHVAGIVGGSGADSNGFYMGIAPGVNLIGLKISDEAGMAYESDTINAMQWVLDNKQRYNIRVVNLSINSTMEQSYHSSPLDAAVEILWFNGIVVVASAGNKGPGGGFNTANTAPANDPFIITVGASDERQTTSPADDVSAPFSAFGTTVDGFVKPDIYAPGTNIVSVLSRTSHWDTQYPDRAVLEGEYFRLSGTSMAAPMVAGAVALLLQDEPNLTPDQVKYRLMHASNTIIAERGSAYLNVYAAVTGTTTESANTGIVASLLLWTGSEPVTWSSVNWNSVNWNSVNWNSVNWNSVNWNSVNWNSVNWNSDYWGP